MASFLGFWSYVHQDDDRDHGRVVDLGHDLVAEYEGLTAERIKLFLDRDDLHWGDQWRAEVDDALSNVAFFVPVLSPLFFKRPECRRELQFFIDKTANLGITRLILPILYIDVPELSEDSPTDPLMVAVKEIQWEPWLDLRFEERASGAYRRGVNNLAKELVRRVQEVEAVDVSSKVATDDEDGGDSADDDPGTLEALAEFEEASTRWVDTLNEISAEITEIGRIFERGNTAMAERAESGRGNFAGRLVVARQIAEELTPSVDRLERLGQSFAVDLGHIDTGMKLMLDQAESEAARGPDEKAGVCGFLTTLDGLQAASTQGLGALAGMITASGPVEKMSRDLRPPLRRMRNALAAMQAAQQTIDSWAAMARGLDIDCSDIGEPQIA